MSSSVGKSFGIIHHDTNQESKLNIWCKGSLELKVKILGCFLHKTSLRVSTEFIETQVTPARARINDFHTVTKLFDAPTFINPNKKIPGQIISRRLPSSGSGSQIRLDVIGKDEEQRTRKQVVCASDWNKHFSVYRLLCNRWMVDQMTLEVECSSKFKKTRQGRLTPSWCHGARCCDGHSPAQTWPSLTQVIRLASRET